MGHTGAYIINSFLPVHPHLCWAYPSLHLAAISQNGSSPHTCGILISPVLLRLFSTVHPHTRGAYARVHPHLLRHTGSSPHTWGIRHHFVCHSTNHRFIPTHVGHTSTGVWEQTLKTVHPHTRGAYSPQLGQYYMVPGSSPHTWGIPLGRRGRCPVARFIPTYVGHTPVGFLVPKSGTVHPHIRGAYIISKSFLLIIPGSSPHTWGIL